MTAAFQPTAPVGDLRVGEVLAKRYEIRALLGVGGMGAVYRVLDRELDEETALKILDPSLASAPDALARFRREVKLARRVTHPNVARTYDLGVHGDAFFLTMELLPGVPLTDRMGAELGLPEALRVAQEISHGLAAAHAVGVVHRDLKPDNVMLAGERVVITDFGIARLAEGHLDSATTATQTIIGTPAYMAPEQIEAGIIDGRTDVYALGVLLFEMMTGALPFGGNTPFAMAAARLTDRIPDPRALRPGLPPRVAELALAALARRREDRPDAQTMVERLAALRGQGNPELTGASSLLRTGTLGPTWSSDPSLERRTVAVRPMDAEPDRQRLARDLERAVVDALTAEQGLRVVLAAPGEGPDPTLSLEGSLRIAGGRARVRLRVTSPRQAAPLWADVVEGDPEDPFALEDAVVERSRAAVRQRLGTGHGPVDPALRARYAQARARYEVFAASGVKEAVEMLQELHKESPEDPSIMALLACALARVWRQQGALDPTTMAFAEELALRALDADPTLGESYHAIGLIRSNSGDYRAAVRALGEALRRAPLMAEAHGVLGQLLQETGHLHEAQARCALAIRLDPALIPARFAITWIHALRGDRARAEQELKEAADNGGKAANVVVEARLAFWWHDPAMALRVADEIENGPRAAWSQAPPLLRAFARGERDAEAESLLGRITSPAVAPRHRCMMHEIAAEYFGAVGDDEAALEQIEAAARLSYIGLAFLDGCPLLEGIRSDPRFSEVRAGVAARAAEIWG